jgi:hypothetical protein
MTRTQDNPFIRLAFPVMRWLTVCLWMGGFGACGDLEGSGGSNCVIGTIACSCTSAGVCDPGLVCRSSVCLSPDGEGAGGSGAPAGAIGATCQVESDCGEKLCIQATDVPGGYCSKGCGGGLVTSGSDCPSGSTCVQVNESSSVCLDECGGSSGGCRGGYICTTADSSQVCLPGCQADEDCDAGMACEVATGECRGGVAARPGRVGGPCRSDSECESGICLADTGTQPRFPGGYCLRPCSAAEVNRPCVNQDGVCFQLDRNDGTAAYACLGSCRTSVDCRGEYMCTADVGERSPAGEGKCLPRCDYYRCPVGQSCDSSVGICSIGEGGGGPPSVTLQSIGSLRTGATRPEYPSFTFDVSRDGASFTIIVDSASRSAIVAVTKITAPGGQVIFDFFNPLGSSMKWNQSAGYGAAYLLFPNAPRLTLVPGTYEVQIGSNEALTANVSILHKRQTGVIGDAGLPVVFWLPRNRYLSAQTAQSDPTFQQAWSRVAQLYAGIGISLGPVTYRDLTGGNAQAYGVIDSEAEVQEMFKGAEASDGVGLNIFLVEQIALDPGAGGGSVLGIAAAIPGPPSYRGIRQGGVAAALAFLRPAVLFADVLAHEVGHYLGLYHSSERDGKSHDPLLDTPECTVADDANGDAILSQSECGSRGATNVMFWATNEDLPKVSFSNDQRFVILRNPAVQ